MRTKVLYEDKHIIIVHKPAGLATQTAHVGQPDVVSELKGYLASSTTCSPYLGVVHRLDQPVEGLLVFAKNKEAAAKLTKQLGTGTLNKRYYAIICGKPSLQKEELVDYLVKDGGIARVGTPGEKEAKRAVLQYEVLREWNGECSLAEVHIDTGRFHQIRLQMAHAGHPILGDLKYGTPESAALSRKYQMKNVALYAYCLDLKHPVTGKELHFSIEPEILLQVPKSPIFMQG